MLLFHIGYHKTASTFLQQAVFDQDSVFYRVNRRNIYHELVFPNPLTWDERAAKEFVVSEAAKAQRSGQIAVFSNERLAGGFHTGGHDSVELLRRLKIVAPAAHVLLCIREQASMIRSVYAQYVKAFGTVSLQEYCYPNYTPHDKEIFHLDVLEYHRLVERYIEVFGSQNVSVLPIEWLKNTPTRFFDEVYRIAGQKGFNSSNNPISNAVAKNVRMTPLQTRVLRRTGPFRCSTIPHIGATYHYGLTSWCCRALVNIAGRLPAAGLNKKLDAQEQTFVDEIVSERFVQSNRKLEKLIGIDLGEIGYVV